MDRLKVSDLKKGMKVRDNDGNYGEVKKVQDDHNIMVKFINSPGQKGCTEGYGIYCLNPKCTDYYDPLYNAE